MDMLRQVLSVLAVLGLLGGTLWWLRTKGMAQFALKAPGGGRTRSLKVIERLALTPQHSLHLVRVADRMVLIASSPNGCSVLDGVSPAVEGRQELQ